MWLYYVVFRMTACGFSCKFSHQSYAFFSIDSLHIEQRIMIVSITQLVSPLVGPLVGPLVSPNPAF